MVPRGATPACPHHDHRSGRPDARRGARGPTRRPRPDAAPDARRAAPYRPDAVELLAAEVHPCPFLDPANGGYGIVAAYSVAIAAGMLLVIWLVTAVGNGMRGRGAGASRSS